jgi:Leucine-rich repeat (LRR) protein
LELYTEDFLNEPTEIKKVFDNFTKIRKLSLTDISCLEKDFFNNLKCLEELYLERVGLREIQSGALDCLNKLTDLDISNNHLSKFEPGIFDKLNNLENLDLSFNPLISIFNKLNKLKSLSFWNCSLAEIHVGAFAGLLNLEQLNLSGNDLEDIKEGTLSELENIKALYLGKWYFYFLVK